LAQSASVAACMAIDAKQTVQQVNIKKLQARLKKDPLLDGNTPEILADNDDTIHTIITGDWKKIKSGGFGPSFYMTAPSDTEKTIKFILTIKVSGVYSAYVYVPKMADGATKTQYIVFNGKNSAGLSINKSDIQVEGQTSGEWISIGKYSFQKGSKAFVLISNKGADGTVVADALLFVPIK